MIANKPEDIWKRIKVGSIQECWPWKGGYFNKRYGRFCIGRQSRLAHRFVYELINGSIPDHLVVMHKCNNKSCCNPAHLILGTSAKNALHASSSGAFKPGRSGISGIGFDRNRNYWTAQGWKKGKRINLYTGPHFEKAIAARKRWEIDNHVSFEDIAA